MRRDSPIKVLIVDDSPLVRTILNRMLAGYDDLHVVATARDAYHARDLILAHKPDVIILDLEMPRMGGLAFMKILRTHYPVPVIVCSGTAGPHSAAALRAMELGAVDVVAKPSGCGREAMRQLGELLAEKIRGASVSRPAKRMRGESYGPPEPSFRAGGLDPDNFLVVLGASTGGTEALAEILARVPADFPPVVIVQHMPAGFTESFAARLDRISLLRVSESHRSERLASGSALLGRGGIQMRVAGRPRSWRVEHGTSELVNRHCPSVDVLFQSVAECAGRRGIGVILTGMGDDGARGLLAMRQAGGLTFGQDKASCVVYGMPKVAAELGAIQTTGSPGEIPRLLIAAMRKQFRHMQPARADA